MSYPRMEIYNFVEPVSEAKLVALYRSLENSRNWPVFGADRGDLPKCGMPCGCFRSCDGRAAA